MYANRNTLTEVTEWYEPLIPLILDCAVYVKVIQNLKGRLNSVDDYAILA